MKRWYLVSIVLTALLLGIYQTAKAEDSGTSEPFTGETLCIPDIYLSTPGDCLALGPSETLTSLAQQGIYYPPRPLPASRPPRELTTSPVNIAKLNLDSSEPANVYGSIEDAQAGKNPVRQIAAGEGLRYVSYITSTEVNGGTYVQLKTGEWMRASPSGYSYFQGLVFHKTPTVMFGWMIDHAKAHSQPSWNAPEVGETLYRETVITIYEIVENENMTWYRIGPDQWMARLDVRQLVVNTTPPEGISGNRWIEINLYNQTLAVYENRQLVFATLVASGGEPYYTRPGLFQIYQKKPLETMSGAFEAGKIDYYYLEDVPWTMYFDQARALHGAYWRAWYGFPGTHGCVNLSIGDSAWLFQWANEGDWVYVWDPSGETPVDPNLYTAGGA